MKSLQLLTYNGTQTYLSATNNLPYWQNKYSLTHDNTIKVGI